MNLAVERDGCKTPTFKGCNDNTSTYPSFVVTAGQDTPAVTFPLSAYFSLGLITGHLTFGGVVSLFTGLDFPLSI